MFVHWFTFLGLVAQSLQELHAAAIQLYQRALKSLKVRDRFPQIYDMALNELAAAHLAYATILQVPKVAR